MVKDQDISSTDKLLGLIRKKSSRIPAAGSADTGQGSRVKDSLSLGQRFEKIQFLPVRKKDFVGVDLTGRSLKMVRMTRTAKSWSMVNARQIPVNIKKDPDDPAFVSFLKRALYDFIGKSSGVRIWSMVSTARAEVININTPKVKSGLANTVFWTTKKEKSFDEKETVLDYRLIKEITDSGIPKYKVCVYLVSREEKQLVTELFSRAGYPLEGLTVSTFALQNLFISNLMPVSEEPFAVLYIDHDSTRIDIFTNQELQLSRAIRAGVDSMVESIVIETTQEEFDMGASVDDALMEEPDSDDSLTMDNEQVYSFLYSRFGENSEESDEDILELIGPALQRLSRQVERTLDHYVNVLGNKPVERVYLAGEPAGHDGIIQFISEQLGLDVERLDPLHPALLLSTSKVALNRFKRVELSMAAALAMSENDYTPNLLFTSKDYDNMRLAFRISRFTATACMLVVILTGGYLWFEKSNIDSLGYEAASLENRLSEFDPLLTREMIKEMSSELQERNALFRKVVQKNLGLAVMGELTNITPGHVQLINVLFEPERSSDNSQGIYSGVVTVEGIIRGDPGMFETYLSGYVYNLTGSLLFSDATVHRSYKDEIFGEGEILRFVINIRLPRPA